MLSSLLLDPSLQTGQLEGICANSLNLELTQDLIKRDIKTGGVSVFERGAA